MKHHLIAALASLALAAPAHADLSGEPVRIEARQDGSLVITLSPGQARECEAGGGCKVISQADLISVLQHVVEQVAAEVEAEVKAKHTCGRPA